MAWELVAAQRKTYVLSLEAEYLIEICIEFRRKKMGVPWFNFKCTDKDKMRH